MFIGEGTDSPIIWLMTANSKSPLSASRSGCLYLTERDYWDTRQETAVSLRKSLAVGRLTHTLMPPAATRRLHGSDSGAA